MDTKYKSKICIIGLLLLNIVQFSAPKLYSTSPQRKLFSEFYISDSKIDNVKACQTVDQAAKFSQLIENRVQDLKTYYTPWQLLDLLQK
ncbi:MAG: hypothetical protein LBD60_03765 [Puniceicoccales bacterium]|jgi:hypothetical protein|nr:hypothetical protein [Puniceicoccales bacterium]